MFLRPNHRTKDGKEHTYWSLVESVRTPDGPRQRTLCHLGELNGADQARWLRTIEVFNEQGEAQQLKLFPSHVQAPVDDPQVARVLVNPEQREGREQRWQLDQFPIDPFSIKQRQGFNHLWNPVNLVNPRGIAIQGRASGHPLCQRTIVRS